MKSFIATLLVAVLVTKTYTIPLNFSQNHTIHTINLNESNHTIQLNKSYYTINLNESNHTFQLSRFNNTTALIQISSIGGCNGTEFGCCLDGNTSASDHFDKCKFVGGCRGTKYGCCYDGNTIALTFNDTCKNKTV